MQDSNGNSGEPMMGAEQFDSIASRLNALRLSNGGDGFTRNPNPSAPPLTRPPSVTAPEDVPGQRHVDGSSDTEGYHQQDMHVPHRAQSVNAQIPVHYGNESGSGGAVYPDLTQFQSQQTTEYQQHMVNLQAQAQAQQEQMARMAQAQAQAQQVQMAQQYAMPPTQGSYYPPQHFAHLPQYQQSYVGSPPPERTEHHPNGLSPPHSQWYSPPGTIAVRNGKNPIEVLGGKEMRKEMKELKHDQEYQQHQVAVSQWRDVIMAGVNENLQNDYKHAERFISEVREQIENPNKFKTLLHKIGLHVGRTMRFGDVKIHTGVKNPEIPVSDEFSQKRWIQCEMKYIEQAVKDFNELPQNKNVVKIVVRFQKNTGALDFIGFEILDEKLKCLVFSKKTGGKWGGTQYYQA